jgi:DNA-binding NtrC family response regulator
MPDITLDTSKKLEVRGGTLRKAGEAKGKGVAIGRDPITVGRGSACTLVLGDPRVSAIHVELVGTLHGVRIQDKGSRNGTYVGGVRVVHGFLTEKAQIVVGDTTLTFEPARVERVELGSSGRFGALVGASLPMRLVYDKASRGAATDLTVLVTGETGTGKELLAHALHDASPRKGGPFVIVDCGAIAPGLAESALFGHERGAFTGAIHRRASPFVEARGGTVLLDEIGELPPDVQPKLLRVLAEKRVKRVGSNVYEDVDVRILAGTRRDLVAAVNAGEFRSDLYFRLAELRIELPPLRERPEDIPLLVADMLRELGYAGGLSRVPEEAMHRLLRHEWPGNVRELANAVTVAAALADRGGPIDPSTYLGEFRVRAAGDALVDLPYHDARKAVLAAFEERYFKKHVALAGGNLAEIARRTGLARPHVRRYVRRHELLPARRRK